jgi:hypothetical protein
MPWEDWSKRALIPAISLRSGVGRVAELKFDFVNRWCESIALFAFFPLDELPPV